MEAATKPSESVKLEAAMLRTKTSKLEAERTNSAPREHICCDLYRGSWLCAGAE
jgi:hypothetical protein